MLSSQKNNQFSANPRSRPSTEGTQSELWGKYSESVNRFHDLVNGIRAARYILLDIEGSMSECEKTLYNLMSNSASLTADHATFLNYIQRHSDNLSSLQKESNDMRGSISTMERMLLRQSEISRAIFSNVLATSKMPSSTQGTENGVSAPFSSSSIKLASNSANARANSDLTSAVLGLTSLPLPSTAAQAQQRIRQNSDAIFNVRKRQRLSGRSSAGSTTSTTNATSSEKSIAKSPNGEVVTNAETDSVSMDHRPCPDIEVEEDGDGDGVEEDDEGEMDEDADADADHFEDDVDEEDLRCDEIADDMVDKDALREDGDEEDELDGEGIGLDEPDNDTGAFVVDKGELEQLRAIWPELSDEKEAVWLQYHDVIVLYASQNGHANVPKSVRCKLPNGSLLYPGRWISRQRRLHNQGKLSDARDRRLQELVDEGLLYWSNSSEYRKSLNTDRWKAMFAYLCAFGEEHGGDHNVPLAYSTRTTDGLELPLGKWLHEQRKARFSNRLAPMKCQLLQHLVDKGQLSWYFGMNNATQGRTDEGGGAAGEFEADDLPSYSMSPGGGGQMPPQQRRELNTHSLLSDTIWRAHFDLLQQYSKNNEANDYDCNIPAGYCHTSADGKVVRLGKWLSKQRTERRKNLLRDDRQKALQALVDEGKLSWDGQKSVMEDKWIQCYEDLVRYGEEHDGNCNIPHDYMVAREDGTSFALGGWLGKQRYYKSTNKLRSDRLDKLQKLVDNEQLQWRMF